MITTHVLGATTFQQCESIMRAAQNPMLTSTMRVPLAEQLKRCIAELPKSTATTKPSVVASPVTAAMPTMSTSSIWLAQNKGLFTVGALALVGLLVWKLA